MKLLINGKIIPELLRESHSGSHGPEPDTLTSKPLDYIKKNWLSVRDRGVESIFLWTLYQEKETITCFAFTYFVMYISKFISKQRLVKE